MMHYGLTNVRRKSKLTYSRPAVTCCVFQLSMDANLHVSKKMDEAQGDAGSDDSLLNMLSETIRGLEAVKLRNHHNEIVGRKGEEPCIREREETWRKSDVWMLSPTEYDKENKRRGSTDEEQVKECKKDVLRVLRELSIFHSDRVTAWRKVLRGSAWVFNKSPPEGSNQQQLSTAGMGHDLTDLNLPFREVKTFEKVHICCYIGALEPLSKFPYMGVTKPEAVAVVQVSSDQ